MILRFHRDVLWILADKLRTICDLAEYDAGADTTTVVNHITYDAFGNVTSETNASVDHLFSYTGRDPSARYRRSGFYRISNKYGDVSDPNGLSQPKDCSDTLRGTGK